MSYQLVKAIYNIDNVFSVKVFIVAHPQLCTKCDTVTPTEHSPAQAHCRFAFYEYVGTLFSWLLTWLLSCDLVC